MSPRLFIALDISDEVRARVAEAVIRERASVDAKWARPEGLHLTLVFFGPTPLEKIGELVATSTSVAARHRPLRLEIAGAGTFDTRVLWLGVGGELQPLQALAADLGRALGVVSDHPEYRPHLTLARSLQRSGDPMLTQVARRLERKSFGAFGVKQLTLYESVGGAYRALAAIPLQAPDQGG